MSSIDGLDALFHVSSALIPIFSILRSEIKVSTRDKVEVGRCSHHKAGDHVEMEA